MLEEEIADRSQQFDRPQPERNVFERAVDTVREVACKVYQKAMEIYGKVFQHCTAYGNYSDKLANVCYEAAGKEKKKSNHSAIYKIHNGIGLSDGRVPNVIVFSGMNCSKEAAVKNGESLILIYPMANIYVVHDGTHGTTNDLIQIGLNKLELETKSVLLGRKLISKCLDKVDSGLASEPIVIHPHSHEGIIAHLALGELEQDPKISVHSVGSAYLFPHGTNIVNRSDLVPCISSPIKFTCGVMKGDSNIKLIGSFKNIPFSTHAFLHEEYQKDIMEKSTTYINLWNK